MNETRNAASRISALLLALSLICTVSVLTGCLVGPKYHRPAAPVSPAYKEPPPNWQGWKQAQPNEAALRGKWWEIYNDPALNALEERVSISNQNVALAEAQYREARDSLRSTRSALFPTLTTSPAITESRISESLATNRPNFISGTHSDYRLPLDVAYEADIWGRVRRSVSSASASAQATAADLENARLLYRTQVAQFYFQLHGLDGDRELLERTVKSYQDYLQLTKDRFNVGVASGADVAQAETQLATTQAQLIETGIQRSQFEHAIAVLVGQPPAGVSIAAGAITRPPPPIPVGVPSVLLERRPDIAAAERRMASANEQIGVATAAFYPTLTLSASAGLESQTIADWFSWPSRFWSVGPVLTQTLFDAGKRRAQVNLAKDNYDAMVASYRQTVLTAFQQVEDELAALRILEDEARAEALAVKAAQQSLDITTYQYKAGIAAYLQVIIAQTAALQSERTAIDTLTRRLAASVLLIQAVGGGWDSSRLPTEKDVRTQRR
jgi:NodT family efflux transporter outer membrane factor (OMF) lipoprotein